MCRGDLSSITARLNYVFEADGSGTEKLKIGLPLPLLSFEPCPVKVILILISKLLKLKLLNIMNFAVFQLNLMIPSRTISISPRQACKNKKWRSSEEIMPLLDTSSSRKKYIKIVVWKTNFRKVLLKKMNFHLRLKQINVSIYLIPRCY